MKHRFLMWISILLFAGGSDVAAEVITPRLAAQLETANADQVFTVWVFFQDKGDLTRSELEDALQTAVNRLSPPAITRRLKEGKSQIVDYRDIAVYRPYVEQVIALAEKHRATSNWLNAISIDIKAGQIDQLIPFDFIRRVQLVAKTRRTEPVDLSPVEVNPTRSRATQRQFDPEDYGGAYTQLNQINVPPLHEEGYAGEGIIIAMLDTGYNLAHEAFEELNVIAQWDFVNDDGNVGYESGDHPNQHRHGTLTLGATVGYFPGRLISPAYEASVILCKTEDVTSETPVEEDNWVEAIEWAENQGASVVSSSLGYIDWYEYEDMDGETATTTIAANTAAENGVLICNSNGNNGGSDYPYMNAPADAFEILAVGAVDSLGAYVSFSSIGPTYDGRIKPEIMAQGRATFTVDANDPHGYTRASGTSLSCPLIAGAAAAVWSKHPAWTMSEVREAFLNTAVDAGDAGPDNLFGWGIADASAAADYFTSVDPDPAQYDTPGALLSLSNFPNPFNPRTTIRYHLPQTGQVTLRIYDLSGRLIRTVVDQPQAPGEYSVLWDGTDDQQQVVESGVYFYRLQTDHESITASMVLLR
ncbi:MAG: T9SS C-terminal target domain-containing protein [Gemmatimonadetes bacterium]|nr:MAG: T9SS C-terminal target domain-containing protein [Gemmatimonadota bacterium]